MVKGEKRSAFNSRIDEIPKNPTPATLGDEKTAPHKSEGLLNLRRIGDLNP